jgi:hypothetical protein
MVVTDRLTRLFNDAEDNLNSKVEAIFADHAAKGCLRSGATIKAAVGALDETTAATVNEALNGIAAITEHSGHKRKRLLSKLDESLTTHHARAEKIVRTRIESIGLGSAFRHARPLIENTTSKHHALICDFRDGWTAPAEKRWNDRHPILFAIIVAIVGAAFGAAGTRWLGG